MKRRQKRRPPQQVSGNEMFFKPKVQKKLAVGKPGDAYEVEADAMADKVVNKTEGQGAVQKMDGAEEEVQQKPLAESISSVQLDAMKKEEPLIHRMEEEEPVQTMEEEEPVQTMEEEEPVQAMEEEEPVQAMEEEEPVQTMEEEDSVQTMEEEEPVQTMVEEEPVQTVEEEEPVQAMEEEEPVQSMEEEEPVQTMEEEEPVQTKSQGKANPSNALERNLKKSKGSGGEMGAKILGEMESSFGTDFSGVRIHTDDTAIQMSEELGAQAFTHGRDIYFNKGKYNPNSKEGKSLLAHELTHTIQQKETVQKKLQKKATHGVAPLRSDIDLFDPATAPKGNTNAIGYTGFYVNGHEVSKYQKENGVEATMNLLFPLPPHYKHDGACKIVNRNIKIKAESEVRVLVNGPWTKKIPKADLSKILGGQLTGFADCGEGDMVRVTFQGDTGAQDLIIDDMKAELQHVEADRCLFDKYIKKYYEEVRALPEEIPTDYRGLGSCESKLNEILNRVGRINDFIEEAAKFARWYDHDGGPHSLVPKVEVNEDCSALTVKIKFKDLKSERECGE